MTIRRISKASKRRLTIFGTISLVAIIYFSFSLIYNIYVIYDLTKQKNELNHFFIELQEETKKLNLDIEKLNDPKYLADFARENYLYSKDNEYIIQIEEIIETKEDISNISNSINRNYIFVGLCFILIIMFAYIFIKSKKSNKKK